MADESLEMRAIREKREAIEELERVGLSSREARKQRPGVALHDAVANNLPEAGNPQRRKWLSALGLLIFTLIGSFAARGRPANGLYYQGAGDIIEALIVGAIIAFVFLAVVGSIGYGISRARGRDKSWRQITFGKAAMITTLVLLILSAAGRAAQHEEAVNKATPNPSGSLTERERANRDAVAWGRRLAAVDSEARAWLTAHRKLLAGLRHGNTPEVRATAAAARAHLVRALNITRAIPDFAEQDLNAERDKFAHILQLQIQGYDLYLTGLRRNARTGLPLSGDKSSLAFLDEGDALIDKAARLSRTERPRLLALDRKYGIPAK